MFPNGWIVCERMPGWWTAAKGWVTVYAPDSTRLMSRCQRIEAVLAGDVLDPLVDGGALDRRPGVSLASCHERPTAPPSTAAAPVRHDGLVEGPPCPVCGNTGYLPGACATCATCGHSSSCGG